MERLDSIPNPFGGTVWFTPSTGSTMNDAERLLGTDGAAGSLVAAGHQSAGQGRFTDRRWLSAAGESLLFTLVVPPGLAAPGKPGAPVGLMLALGLCGWLDTMGLDTRIKWPNDILVGQRKLAGILVAGTRGHFLAGIGINFKQASFPPDLRRPGTSLWMEGRNEAPLECLGDVLAHTHTAFGRHDWRRAAENRLWALGSTACLALPDGRVAEGIVEGLGEDGSLLLSSAGGPLRLVSGE